jgi:hypothetical protein
MKIAGEVDLEAKLKERLGWGEETETPPETDEIPEV